MTTQHEWVTLEVLLKRGEYPVITDLIHLGQRVNTALFFLQKFEPKHPPIRNEDIVNAMLALKKLKCDIEVAVSGHTKLKIERRLSANSVKNGRRGTDEKEGDENGLGKNSKESS